MSQFMSHLVLISALLLASASANAADIYRCDTESGVRFADAPCGEQFEKIRVRDNRLGGNFGENLPEPASPDQSESGQDEPESAEAQSTCRYINSIDLRRYLIREQVVPGMTQQNVLDAFGRPQETYPTPQQTWIYETKYYGALYELTYVYFRDGCVESVQYRKP